MNTVLTLENITKDYGRKAAVRVLSNINVQIQQGEFVALMGSSGSGKSTILHIAGLLEVPTSGTVTINNTKCAPASDRQRTITRRNSMGFVYQFHHLLQELSVIENVMLPQRISGHALGVAKKRAVAVLAEVGLEHKINSQISSLSGGEKQRVAIARGVVNCPSLLLADEPTGSLDPKTSEIAFSMMHKYVKENNLAAFVATHNYNLAQKADKILLLHNGTLTLA